MFKNFSLLKPVALAALCVAAGASQAAITVYTTQASFLAAVINVGTDGFSDISLTGISGSPAARTAGVYSYTATSFNAVGGVGDTFYGAGTAANPWLSTNDAQDTIRFSGFSGNVNAIGGNFFGSDINGAYLSGDITLTVVDSSGTTLTRTITAATTNSFLGFVSTTGTMSSLLVASAQGLAAPVWATVDNLALAVTAVPEPQTYAMLLAGLGVVGFVARRRG